MKKLLALILATVMVLGLVACGGNGGEETTAAPVETTGEAPAESTAAPAEPTDEIVYWSMWTENEPQGIVIKEAAAAYEAATGVHVNIEWKGRDITQVLKAALDAGENVDVFDDDFQRVSTQFAANCLSLEEMAKAAGYDDFAVPALPNAVRSWAGELVCIPYQPYTSGIFYTQSSFDAAGITAEPQTWAEFLEVCQKLKDAGYTPLAQDDAYTRYTFGFVLATLQDVVSLLLLTTMTMPTLHVTLSVKMASVTSLTP